MIAAVDNAESALVVEVADEGMGGKGRLVLLTLNDEEVGRIAADEFPLAVGVLLEAVDAELGELPIATSVPMILLVLMRWKT